MSKRETIAYKATDPGAVRASLDRWQEERTAFFQRAAQFSIDRLDGEHELAIVGNGRGMWANHLEGDWRLDGKYHRREKVAEVPPGWHYYQKEGEVRPYRGGRDKASREAVQALADLNATSPGDLRTWLNREFDVPMGAGGGFGFEPVGETFYVLMGSGPFSPRWEDGNEHFERVPMSTYWLDREAAEEAA